MDPTVALADIRQRLQLVQDHCITFARRDAHAVQVAEKFNELDTWLSNGGFPPAQWGNLTTKNPVTSGSPAPPAQRTRPTATVEEIQELLRPTWGGA